MPLVLGISKSLALEDVPQMSTTVVAYDLRPLHSPAVVDSLTHSAWNGVPEGGPAAPRVEFMVGLVEGRVATSAGVDASGGVVLIVFARMRRFGPLLTENTELIYGDVRRRATCRCSRRWTYRATTGSAIHPQAFERDSLCCLAFCWMIQKVHQKVA